MHIGMGIDTANNGIRVGSYEGHSHPSSYEMDRGGTHLPGGWTTDNPDLESCTVRQCLPPDR